MNDIVVGANGCLYKYISCIPSSHPDKFVYDIEVQDNHNFVVRTTRYGTEQSGVVAHNCHHISAEVFCRSLFKVVTPYMLGLSATMNRKDGLTKVFKQFLGDVLYILRVSEALLQDA